MMNRIVTAIVLGGSLLLFGGCGSGGNDNAVVEQKPGVGSQEFNLPLELNDGQKWEVDSHTRGSAERMALLLEESAPFKGVEDASSLGKAFDSELGLLVRGCTMSGPAHDQLHVFLAALFPRVEDLKSKTDMDELRTTKNEIVMIFDAYREHFE